MAKMKRVLLTMGVLFSALPVYAGSYSCSYGLGGGFGKSALLMITLAVGYWVLTLAVKQKKPMDRIGKIIGGLIVLVSLGGLICSAYYRYCKYKCSKAETGCTYKADKYHGTAESAEVTP